MIFAWLRERRRRAIRATPFPVAWLTYLSGNVGVYAALSPADQARLRDLLRVFIAEKEWEGCSGFEVTDEVRVTIAAQACLLILELGDDSYAQVTSILVYPGGFNVPIKRTDGGLVTEFDEARSGEAHVRGPVVLAWDDVLESGRSPGHGWNVVYHEFAHQLDFLDGVIDGTPPLHDAADYQAWTQVMGSAFAGVQQSARARRRSVIGDYAAQDPGEFFAVVTEQFFDQPASLAAQHADVYALLKRYYRQDPVERQRGR